MTQDMGNKILTQESTQKGRFRCVVDDITSRRQRNYGSSATTLRLAVTLLLMMVVGVSGVWGQTTLQKPTISVSDNTVTITSDNAEGDYYYTTGPNEPLTPEPTTSSPSVKYTDPFTISNDVMCIKAIAVHQSTRSEVTTYNILHFTDNAINVGTESDVTVAPLIYSCDLAKPSGMTPYIVSRITPLDHNAILKEVGYIPEGVPVLLLDNGKHTGSNNITLEPIDDLDAYLADLDVNKDTDPNNNVTSIPASDKAANQLRVSDGKVVVADAQVYMYYNGEFVLTFGGTLKAGRYYMYNPNYTPSSTSTPAGAPALQLVIESNTTGIVEMRNEELEMRNGNDEMRNAWCTLDGRRLTGQPVRKGIFINNCQKRVVQ